MIKYSRHAATHCKLENRYQDRPRSCAACNELITVDNYMWKETHARSKQRNVSPVGTRGLKSRKCPPYPHACRKRRLKWGTFI